MARLVPSDAAQLCVAGVALGDADLHFAWAGVALGDTDLHFAWHVWHWMTSTCTLRGRRCAHGIGLALLARLVPRDATPLCTAGVAPGDIRHGNWRHQPSLCVAGVALGEALPSRRHHSILLGRRGTWRHRLLLCVAGVALGDTPVHFARQALPSWHWAGSGGGLLARDAAPFCATGMALDDINLHSARQASSTCILRGKPGAYGAGLALVACLASGDTAPLCLAGVRLGDIGFHFAWQGWRLATSTCTLRGKPGAYGTGLALVACLASGDTAPLCLAGVPLGDISLHLAWQARPLVTSIRTLCGKRCTYGTGLALVVRLVPGDNSPDTTPFIANW